MCYTGPRIFRRRETIGHLAFLLRCRGNNSHRQMYYVCSQEKQGFSAMLGTWRHSRCATNLFSFIFAALLISVLLKIRSGYIVNPELTSSRCSRGREFPAKPGNLATHEVCTKVRSFIFAAILIVHVTLKKEEQPVVRS